MKQDKKPLANQPISMITGQTGQDASYLAEYLLKQGHYVVGLKRRTSLINTERIDHIYYDPYFKLEYYDLDDVGRIWELLLKYRPQYLYNLAAQSHVAVSFQVSENTFAGIADGTLAILNAIKGVDPTIRFYQASSSEMFGTNPQMPLNEGSTFMPASPYACAKLAAHHLVGVYRDSYGLHASSGILFNHESSRRGETFVTRKICLAAARIKLGQQSILELGNLDAKRDWGHASDYTEAMFLMLQQDTPDDYVIATGETHTVREFLEVVFDKAELSIDKHVKINERLFRPNEVPTLLGDSSKARRVLGWEPKIKFEELATSMYESDLRLIKGE